MIFLLTVSLLMMAGCTTNDGDIGFIGGNWRLDTISIDGMEDTSYSSNITWAFQSNIIEMSVTGPHHSRDNHFGTWSFTDGILTLDFSHSDNDHPQGTGEYAIPPQLHLPGGTKVPLHLDSMKGDKMTLSGIGNDNKEITFHLSKIY